MHVQVHGQLPNTLDAVHTLHKFVVGIEVKLEPFEEPHTQLIIKFALQLTSLQSYCHKHVRVHGQVPDTSDAIHESHNHDVGADEKFAQSDEPQVQFSILFALQDTSSQVFSHTHVQVQGQVPNTSEATPKLHKSDIGAVERFAQSDEPQAQFVFLFAIHSTLLQSFCHIQVQVHGQVPNTSEAVHESHNQEVG